MSPYYHFALFRSLMVRSVPPTGALLLGGERLTGAAEERVRNMVVRERLLGKYAQSFLGMVGGRRFLEVGLQENDVDVRLQRCWRRRVAFLRREFLQHIGDENEDFPKSRGCTLPGTCAFLIALRPVSLRVSKAHIVHGGGHTEL
jgi:hypothetical protein